jgi:hypothetical protein
MADQELWSILHTQKKIIFTSKHLLHLEPKLSKGKAIFYSLSPIALWHIIACSSTF